MVRLTRPLALGSVVMASVACSTDDTPSEAVAAEDCIVWLHGRGDAGGPPTVEDGVAHLHPSANRPFESGRVWIYDTADAYAEAVGIVRGAADEAGCTRVALDGFSNGGSFAAALHCDGEDLDGRLVGVVVDDPVTDGATAGCDPAPGVEVALYWTGALEALAPPGSSCEAVGFTCEGDTVLAVADYAAALGTPVRPSPFEDHRWHLDAPELRGWLS